MLALKLFLVQMFLPLICAMACQAARAERSLLVDEIDRGDCEAELGFLRETARDTALAQESSVQLVCGIGWRTELTAAFSKKRSADARDEAIGFEGRTTLRARRIGGLGWTLGYGLGAERAAGGGPWRHTEQFIAVEAIHQPGTAWWIEATIGTSRNRIERRDSTLWGLAVEYAITEAVEARASVSGDDRSPPWTSVELRYLFWPEHAWVMLTYGVKASPLHERQLGLGVTFAF